jgi:hypothetical protein
LIQLLENRNAVSARAEPDGCGKPAEAGADNDGMGTGIVDFGLAGKRAVDHGRSSWPFAPSGHEGSVCGAKRSMHPHATDLLAGHAERRGL